MRNRRERPLAELYVAIERLTQPKAYHANILEGTCRIEGPVDEYDYEPQRIDSGVAWESLSGLHNSNTMGTC
ncbi:hypothetical protein Cni_G26323 [Canna indica]|uniref:Uncharacterized protein n=1 Tax=Canna indica TaxID=4628 RepID=A0AAQ3KZK7_9LILI|nr:hypothetical protein Cni_G26323 [Canna indica]